MKEYIMQIKTNFTHKRECSDYDEWQQQSKTKNPAERQGFLFKGYNLIGACC
jgi:hypothetical protein